MQFRLQYDVGPFVKNLTDIEVRQFPYAMMQALNETMFKVRKGWQDAMPRVFDRPTPLTMLAILYHKATRDNLVAEVYVRDEAFKGTPPASYLISQVEGGARVQKPFEQMLRSIGLMNSSEAALPARGVPLDQFGNLGGGRTKAILADLHADRERYAHSNSVSRRKRRIRNRRKEGQGVYFASRGPSGNRGDGSPQHLPHGIYERMSRGFTGPTRGGARGVRMVLAIVKQPTYRVRFDARGLAQELFDKSFPTAFQIHFARAVLNAKP